jgi:hypothetical protein
MFRHKSYMHQEISKLRSDDDFSNLACRDLHEKLRILRHANRMLSVENAIFQFFFELNNCEYQTSCQEQVVQHLTDPSSYQRKLIKYLTDGCTMAIIQDMPAKSNCSTLFLSSSDSSTVERFILPNESEKTDSNNPVSIQERHELKFSEKINISLFVISVMIEIKKNDKLTFEEDLLLLKTRLEELSEQELSIESHVNKLKVMSRKNIYKNKLEIFLFENPISEYERQVKWLKHSNMLLKRSIKKMYLRIVKAEIENPTPEDFEKLKIETDNSCQKLTEKQNSIKLVKCMLGKTAQNLAWYKKRLDLHLLRN